MENLLQKTQNALRIVRQNGGIWKSLQTYYRTDELKDGELIGEDRFGNKYYQNKRYYVGKWRFHFLFK
jgi:NADH:ubiquinone oxidoreductase subunit